MENNNPLSKLDHHKVLDIISTIPHLTERDRNELSKKVVSDDVEIRKSAFEKLAQSQIAQNDLIVVQGEIAALNKQGMYVKAKQSIKTGSGQVEIEMKGGDTKLIIPVLVIVGVIVIAALVIVFWK